ncbi:MFS general substrate transporter [Fistulina hepatica ATCC 64428]|uniref:MFS general substrate transporter n=1 Tax=Fistulina hepatica ATCC 64428 TaxID=1128425 RepID=A0A0D7AFM1_9AGAR|nr:MFS general substrate transporter [Fistulina hepatica ATCC 64428]
MADAGDGILSDPEKLKQEENSTSSGHDETISLDENLEKTVWRKMDTWVLPVAAVFYLLSFLDRTNLGNARIAGLQTDLKMTDYQYSVALTVTYVPYIVAELPSNLLLKVRDALPATVGPNLMLPTMLTCWGIITTLQGVVHNYSGLLACRFFLGLCEGGVFPGLVLYLSFFYPRHKLQMRISTFFSFASLAGAFGGILAYGIIHMDGVGEHMSFWAWVFILEGIVTVLVALVSFAFFPRSPETARFLSQEERHYVVEQLRHYGVIASKQEIDAFSWGEVVKVLFLPQVWFMGVHFFFNGVILYGLAYFSPTIISVLGYTDAKAQLMSVPPYAVAFVCALTTSYISDRFQCRGAICIVGSILCIIGFAMFLGSYNMHVQYGSLFFSITGTYVLAPSEATWNAVNVAPHTRKASAIAFGFIMTNSGGILATWLLGSLSTAPRYTKATITLLIMSVLLVVVSIINMLFLWTQNKKKAITRSKITKESEPPNLGDQSAWFNYSL